MAAGGPGQIDGIGGIAGISFIGSRPACRTSSAGGREHCVTWNKHATEASPPTAALRP